MLCDDRRKRGKLEGLLAQRRSVRAGVVKLKAAASADGRSMLDEVVNLGPIKQGAMVAIMAFLAALRLTRRLPGAAGSAACWRVRGGWLAGVFGVQVEPALKLRDAHKRLVEQRACGHLLGLRAQLQAVRCGGLWGLVGVSCPSPNPAQLLRLAQPPLLATALASALLRTPPECLPKCLPKCLPLMFVVHFDSDCNRDPLTLFLG
jgi:hypothetical protein